MRWDAGWYLRIARHGYGTDTVHAPAFFPLYPGACAVLGRLIGDYALAGLLISLIACFIAFQLLWRLTAEKLGEGDAPRAVVYLAFFPMAVFLQADYSESLFLAFALAAFLAAEHDRWAIAGVAASGALLTRSVGIAVVAGLAVLAWPHARRLVWLVLPGLAFISFPLVLRHQTHDAWSFIRAQDEWDRHLSPAGPLGGIWEGFVALGRTTKYFTHAHYLAVNIENLVFLGLFVALLPLAWRWFGAAYGVFAAVALALPLSFPAGAGVYPLISLPRFGLLIFPFFMVLSRLGRTERAHTVILATSALGLGVAIVQWATFRWVA